MNATKRILALWRATSNEHRGRAAFFEWLNEDPPYDLIRSQLFLKFFFGEHLDDATLRRFAMIHRPKHERRLAYFRKLLPLLQANAPWRARTLEFGIRFEEAVLDWFDAIPWPGVGSVGSKDARESAGAAPRA